MDRINRFLEKAIPEEGVLLNFLSRVFIGSHSLSVYSPVWEHARNGSCKYFNQNLIGVG